MHSFEAGHLTRQPVSHGLVQTLRLLGEYKGKQDLWREQSPEVLERLTASARIESTESSNRIEGVTIPSDRLDAIVRERANPRDRSEQEIAGYRDVLSTIHTNWRDMQFSAGLVLQLHRDLFQFTPSGGGRWKPVDNEISELVDGKRSIRFKPVPAAGTEDAMRRLHAGFEHARAAGEADPLLLLSAYILDFTCIHPFLDGNGRMARLLTLLLLYQAGYHAGRYISVERIIEQQRDGYYDSLYASAQRWHQAQHSLTPWWEYSLGVVLVQAYRELERNVTKVTGGRGAKRQAVIDAVGRLPATFQHGDIARACPGVSRPTIERILTELRDSGRIRKLKSGRAAVWEKVSTA